MQDNEILYTMAFSMLPKMYMATWNVLTEKLETATAIYEHRYNLRDVFPDISSDLQDSIARVDMFLPRCHAEMEWAERNRVACIPVADTRFPERLKQAQDAPIMLYMRGNADLNKRHIISMVGTRQMTDYGREMCERFIQELPMECPDVMVLSGLAYGVDIHCHRFSLKTNIPTVGILAHGLDRVYPTLHRDTAVQMENTQGCGLVSEFMSNTSIEKRFFVQRNRIIAACADAVIVAESAIRGGSLITAEIANSYDKDVFAFPGRATDKYSQGCNMLIAGNSASLVQKASDFVEAMGWQDYRKLKEQQTNGVQQELFPVLSKEEQLVVNCLKEKDMLQMNNIAILTGIAVGHLSGILFSMEMRGILRMMPGGMYRLQYNV